ncbi:hypothetical protein EON66_03295 [archaeon]|nr:MAG: hypothetical protein EON66_03295 [archaeon]
MDRVVHTRTALKHIVSRGAFDGSGARVYRSIGTLPCARACLPPVRTRVGAPATATHPHCCCPVHYS